MTGTTPIDVIIQGDCLEEMRKLPGGCIDMILCDLPYGTTACKWDHVIPLEPLWKEYKRLIKDRGAIVLTASQPFTSVLITSNKDMFKYCMVWKKTRPSDFLNAKNKPMKYHEDICIFSLGTTANKSPNKMIFNPQMRSGKPYTKLQKTDPRVGAWDAGNRTPYVNVLNMNDGVRYPSSVIEFPNDNHDSLHPTQKPVALFEYLIKTYTNEGDLVLDNCIGSGTTAVAAKRTGRHFIGIELSEEYCEIARKRVAAVPARLDRWAEADA